MLDLYSSSSNLGDNLALTPLVRSIQSTVHLYDDPCVRSIAPIFEGICDIAFDNGSPSTHSPRSSDPGHPAVPATKRLLIAHKDVSQEPDTEWDGIEPLNPVDLLSVPAIPSIKLHPWEQRMAKDFAVQFKGKNLCVLKCNPQELNERTPPIELLRKIVADNPTTTFLNFGLSKNHAKSLSAHVSIDGVENFFDLPIRQLATFYAAIGRYIGPDTGDYHLMLAVGGKCDVLVPPSSPTYPHPLFHYGEECWLNQPSRVRYHDWSKAFEKSLTGIKL